jgi:predicted MFS family arabinose efflux permease
VTLQLTAGVLIGLGIAGSAFLLVTSAFARILPPEMRTIGFGIGTAAGSIGQFIFAPLGQGFISAYGWHTALLLMASFILVIPALSFVVRGRPSAAPVRAGEKDQSIAGALREAFGHGSYRLLVLGFFVCGFQVMFITVHLPPYLNDIGIPAQYGAIAIGLIGLFNIVGSFSSGVLSGRMPRRTILIWLYLVRSIVIAAFILLPPSVPSVLIFSALIGLLWLSTVPPTQQLVVVMFGTRYLATLFGLTLLSHQIGGFLGAWLGGIALAQTGNYEWIWYADIALALLAAAANLPIREARLDAQPAAA